MSRVLGPIHHWLYRKIKVQRSLISELIEEASQNQPELKSKYTLPWSDNESLEDLIDVTNIHGWLQDQVHEVEQLLAEVVRDITVVNPDALSFMKEVCVRVGKCISSITEEDNAIQIYQELNDSLLDGMPCDRVNMLLEQSESEVVWERRTCLHEPFYTAVGLDVCVYYELRDAMIQGMLANSNAVFRHQGSTYRITGGQQ